MIAFRQLFSGPKFSFFGLCVCACVFMCVCVCVYECMCQRVCVIEREILSSQIAFFLSFFSFTLNYKYDCFSKEVPMNFFHQSFPSNYLAKYKTVHEKILEGILLCFLPKKNCNTLKCTCCCAPYIVYKLLIKLKIKLNQGDTRKSCLISYEINTIMYYGTTYPCTTVWS